MKRALPRFLYGFLSSSTEPINIAIPFRPSDRDGLFKMNYSKLDAERDNLLLWAHTNKGERVMNFDFGLDARRYLFEPMSTLKDGLVNNTREQMKKYFPHLLLEEVNVLTSEEDTTLSPNSVRYILKARIKSTNDLITLNEEIR